MTIVTYHTARMLAGGLGAALAPAKLAGPGCRAQS